MSKTCTCGGTFLDAEDFRDHMPCPGTAADARVAELERELQGAVTGTDLGNWRVRALRAEARIAELEKGNRAIADTCTALAEQYRLASNARVEAEARVAELEAMLADANARAKIWTELDALAESVVKIGDRVTPASVSTGAAEISGLAVRICEHARSGAVSCKEDRDVLFEAALVLSQSALDAMPTGSRAPSVGEPPACTDCGARSPDGEEVNGVCCHRTETAGPPQREALLSFLRHYGWSDVADAVEEGAWEAWRASVTGSGGAP